MIMSSLLSPTAIKPSDIMDFFKPVFKQAKELSSAYEGSQTTKIPFVTVSEPEHVWGKIMRALLLKCGMGLAAATYVTGFEKGTTLHN